MPIAADLKRFTGYTQELMWLCKQYGITGRPRTLWRGVRNPEFKRQFREICGKVVEADGGKLSLSTLLAVIGAAFGGVGIAAGGGAIGLPLALVLGSGGYFAGAELDSMELVKKIRAFFRQGDPAAKDRASDEIAGQDQDLEQITSLVEELLARTEAGEKKASELCSRVEQYEEEMLKRHASDEALQTKVRELEKVASEARIEIAQIRQRLQVLIWVALPLATIALAGMFWILFRR